MPLITRAGLGKAFADVSASALCAMFAYAHLTAFRAHARASLAVAVVVEGLFALFILIRSHPRQTSRSGWDWAIAFIGMTMPFLLRPTGAEHDIAVGQGIQLFGSAAAVLGILSLNRSAGIVPSNRGVKTSGLYRCVRHPLYSAYTISHAGYLINNYSLENLAVVLLAFAAQLLRIRNEERLLSSDSAYVAYQARTRWRLLPFVY